MASNSTTIEIPETSKLNNTIDATKTTTTEAINIQALSSSPSSMAIDKTLSSAANLVKLLPTGTVLTYQALSPSFTNRGNCMTSNKFLTATLIILCTMSSIFFSFTDSFKGSDGKLYYGIATFKGFSVFNFEGSDEDKLVVFTNLSKFRIRILDYVHAFFSMFVFLSLAFSDTDTQNCFVPVHQGEAAELLQNLPLGIGFISALVFMIFPTTRKGIGYTDSAPQTM